jgi:hypothetical protein
VGASKAGVSRPPNLGPVRRVVNPRPSRAEGFRTNPVLGSKRADPASKNPRPSRPDQPAKRPVLGNRPQNLDRRRSLRTNLPANQRERKRRLPEGKNPLRKSLLGRSARSRRANCPRGRPDRGAGRSRRRQDPGAVRRRRRRSMGRAIRKQGAGRAPAPVRCCPISPSRAMTPICSTPDRQWIWRWSIFGIGSGRETFGFWKNSGGAGKMRKVSSVGGRS